MWMTQEGDYQFEYIPDSLTIKVTSISLDKSVFFGLPAPLVDPGGLSVWAHGFGAGKSKGWGGLI